MCSQPSQRKTPSPTEHVAALKQAFIDVAQESYFSYAEACGADRFGEALDALDAQSGGTPVRWLEACVDFAGAFAGRVRVALPYQLAVDMAAALSGAMPGDDVPESDVVDSTGEFANMVCGTWLTRSCVRRRFDLQPPQVAATAPARLDSGAGAEWLLVNDQPVSMIVAFQPA